MNNLWLALIAISFAVMAVFFVYVLLELRKSARALTEFLNTTENTLRPTLEELQVTLKSLRKVTDDINGVTGDIRLISGSTRDIGNELRKVSRLAGEISSDTIIKVSGLRVGIRTALEVLLKNIFLKKGDS